MDRITIHFKSREPDEDLSLEEFSRQIAAWFHAFSHLDKMLSGKSSAGTRLRIVGLSHGSEAAVTIEASAKESSARSNARRIFPEAIRAIENLNAGRVSETLPRGFLESFQEVALGLRRELKEMNLEGNGNRIMVTDEALQSVESFLRPQLTYTGTIRGELQLLNLHKGENMFRVYPVVGPNYITCYFNSSMKEKVKEAVDRYVEISGVFYHKHGEDIPYQVDVKSIEIFPDEANLPTMEDIRGMVKVRKGTSAEDLLEQERHGNW
jgi:hypothetical protein